MEPEEGVERFLYEAPEIVWRCPDLFMLGSVSVVTPVTLEGNTEPRVTVANCPCLHFTPPPGKATFYPQIDVRRLLHIHVDPCSIQAS